MPCLPGQGRWVVDFAFTPPPTNLSRLTSAITTGETPPRKKSIKHTCLPRTHTPAPTTHPGKTDRRSPKLEAGWTPSATLPHPDLPAFLPNPTQPTSSKHSGQGDSPVPGPRPTVVLLWSQTDRVGTAPDSLGQGLDWHSAPAPTYPQQGRLLCGLPVAFPAKLPPTGCWETATLPVLVFLRGGDLPCQACPP